VRTPLLLYALALGVRLLLVAHFPDPAYPDSFYYADVARALHDGRGFNVDFVWIFAEVGGKLPAHPMLPIPSNAHWMPLASLVQVPFLAVFGEQAWAGALPFAVVGALVAPLAWRIGVDAGARPLVSIGAGILAAIPVLATPFVAQPDNFGLYEPAAAGALWLAGRALKGGPNAARDYALAGLLVGLATLSRNDAVLVGAIVALAFAWDRWRAWHTRGGRHPAIPLAAVVACVVLFAVCVVPWFARQLAVFGSLSPSTASGKVLFIRDIGEWDSITTPATLDHLLGMGLGPLLATRIEGLIAAVTIFGVLVGGVVLVPFMLVGARRRRSVDFGPFFGYAILLFAFSALVSAVHVPGGTFIHSAIALAPHAYVLALEGVLVAVGWIAARRRGWNATEAERVFVGAAVAFAVVVGALGSVSVHATWDASRRQFQAVAVALTAAGAPTTDHVMSIDASGTKYWTGRGGVVLVNDPLPTIEEVARAYDVRWLVLDRADAVPAVAPILDEDARPAWIGKAVLTSDGPDGLRDSGLYPVCFDAADARCSS